MRLGPRSRRRGRRSRRGGGGAGVAGAAPAPPRSAHVASRALHSPAPGCLPRPCGRPQLSKPRPRPVHRPQPQVAPAAVGVGAGQGPLRHADAGPGERLRRERQRLAADHLQRRALGGLARQQVEHHGRAEPGRAHTEAGVPQRVGDPAAVGGAEERGEAGAGVDGPAPRVAEADALQLREAAEEVLGERQVGLGALVQLGADPAAEGVDRVVAAPEDAAVGGEPEVVELVGAVPEALPVPPPDWRPAAPR